MEKRKVPAVRFKGFEDDWEQRKLGDCFTERVESMPGGELISVTINEGIKKFSELGRHDNSNDDKSKYKKVCVGDIAYNSMRMWQGASGYSPYEGIVSPAYTVLSPNSGINSKCLAYQFKLPEMIHIFQINSQGITSDNWNLKYPALSEIEIFVSKDEEEQVKIAGYFTKLDHLITLHQRKLEKLYTVKKSMLEKMFPKNGSKIPEIRFEGFTDDWEQRKLGEVYTERNEKGQDDLEILSVSIHHGVSNGELDADLLGKNIRRSEDKSLYKHVYYGDLVFNMMRAWQGAIGVVKSEGMVSPAYVSAVPDEKIYSEFMDYCLRRKQVIAQINNLSYGVTDFRKRLYWDSFVKVDVMLPSTPEQKKITDAFRNLDHLITLHQRKLEKMKNIKKSLLEKMFI